jgi:hypothetical protein
MKIFKYFETNLIKPVQKRFKVIHEQMLSVGPDGKMPYNELYNWFVEITQYGILLAFAYADVFIWIGWLKWICFPFAMGISWWLWHQFIGGTTEVIKGNL